MRLAADSWGRRLGVASMVGLAALTASAPIPAAQPPQMVQCKVLDEFPATHDRYGVSHGTLVEQVLESRSMADCERVQVGLGASMSDLNQMQPGGLEDYVVQRFAVPTQNTAEALDRISQEGVPTVASQSQGASESRVIEALWGRARSSAEFRSYLEQELGLTAGTSDTTFLQTLVDRVADIHAANPEIQSAREQLLASADNARQSGVVRVISAGNQGQLGHELESMGVSLGSNFYLSDLADSNAIIVGASDHHYTADASDDGAASIASPNAGAFVGAQGVNVPILVVRENGSELQQHTGSSYAQPQVASVVMGMLQGQTSLGVDQIKDQLLEQARPIPGAEAHIGGGIIDLDWIVAGAPTS